ncbi:hypothetical protein [Aliivibrio fischeri]|uniref:Uncharacterized protein n=1 Tax=Aliivibrio fischeri SR5 TaxID=1088719 RepID=A0AAV3EM36_ALIFS|nr:hypothetical protein [Aliivibrio fischeri]EHN67933.1 hypothetical protein VFSR5_2750 [Aliivibrio fischeri SR5]
MNGWVRLWIVTSVLLAIVFCVVGFTSKPQFIDFGSREYKLIQDVSGVIAMRSSFDEGERYDNNDPYWEGGLISSAAEVYTKYSSQLNEQQKGVLRFRLNRISLFFSGLGYERSVEWIAESLVNPTLEQSSYSSYYESFYKEYLMKVRSDWEKYIAIIIMKYFITIISLLVLGYIIAWIRAGFKK